jgi:hypothetical protein
MMVTLKYFDNPLLTSATLNNPLYLDETHVGTILFLDLLEIETALVVVELISLARLMSYKKSNNSNILEPMHKNYKSQTKNSLGNNSND